jgi:hypothetical protein
MFDNNYIHERVQVDQWNADRTNYYTDNVYVYEKQWLMGSLSTAVNMFLDNDCGTVQELMGIMATVIYNDLHYRERPFTYDDADHLYEWIPDLVRERQATPDEWEDILSCAMDSWISEMFEDYEFD